MKPIVYVNGKCIVVNEIGILSFPEVYFTRDVCDNSIYCPRFKFASKSFCQVLAGLKFDVKSYRLDLAKALANLGRCNENNSGHRGMSNYRSPK